MAKQKKSKNLLGNKAPKKTEIPPTKKPKVSASPSKSTSVHQNRFPIVGIGASAGGLEAFSQLLSHLPLNTGMGFVLIQHLDPSHESMSADILSRTTKMPVHEVQDGVRVEPNHVYVIPPNTEMSILLGTLSLFPRPESRHPHMVIDSFFQSLAQDQKARAIGVILSGTASDGTLGLKAIKAEGGLALVQDPKSAKYDGMPRNAVASGIVDMILPPEEIAQELARIATHPYIASACELAQAQTSADDGEDDKTQIQAQPDQALRKIFLLLRSHTQVDFSNYKHTTLKRRIQRRMMVRKTESFAAYARYLQDHQEEVKALFADLLIHVTEFFRDPDSFKALSEQVFPKLTKRRDDVAPIRIWVPGCSTGEEAYSIAILLLEFLGDSGGRTPIQIFATDISEQAIQKARLGEYSESIELNVSEERLGRFFEKTPSGYKINKAVRDLCLFSRHDVTCDPPFASLDVISCRNVLIYFAAILQKQVLPTFHYSLKPGGFLWLGRSESPIGFSKLFSLEDKTNKIYSKVNIPTPMTFRFPAKSYATEVDEITRKPRVTGRVSSEFQSDADKIAITNYSPSGVVVNADFEILQFRGRTSPYLEPASGLASNQLFKMVRQELLPGLRMTVQSAAKQNRPVRKEGLSFEVDGKRRVVNIEVTPANPLDPPKQKNFVIFFEEVLPTLLKKSGSSGKTKQSEKKRGNKNTRQESGQRLIHVEQELSASRHDQQSMAEEFEATKEELTSANEELQSTNEELQSTNEELETAKEELQSSNEELSTVNDELQNRNSELVSLSSDLNNLLVSVELPILIIGSDRRIRRFTPTAEKFFSLIPSDVGRPISDIKPCFDLDLGALVFEVAQTLTPQEKEIKDHSGRWKRIRIRPYKTTDNRIDGAVVAVMDIDALKESLNSSDVALRSSKAMEEQFRTLANTLPQLSWMANADGHVFWYNQRWYDYTGTNLEEMLKSGWKTILQSDQSETIQVDVKEKWKKGETWEANFLLRSKSGEFRSFLTRAEPIKDAEGRVIRWFGTNTDTTEQVNSEKALAKSLTWEREARAEAEKGNQAKDLFLATLSHELRAPLTSILSWAQLLNMGKLDAEKSKQATKIIETSARAQGQLISDLLDVSRIIMGKLPMEMHDLDLASVIHAAHETVRLLAEEKSVQIKIELDPKVKNVSADPMRLQQVFWNLLTNAIKFSEKGSEIEVRLEQVTVDSKECAQIQVIDSGKGIRQDFLPHIFEKFSQADNTCTRKHGGLGLGLAIVRNLVELQGGTVQVSSPGEGKGSTFTVILPLAIGTNDVETHGAPVKRKDPLQPSAGKEVDDPKLDGVRVLIVDDEENAREAFATLLKSFGADARAAGSAREALVIFREFKPHVLVSDIGMPGEDGYSLIHKIRALGPKAGGNVPALALTAYASGADVERAHSAGFCEHLAKPVDSHDLGRMIAELAARPTGAKKKS